MGNIEAESNHAYDHMPGARGCPFAGHKSFCLEKFSNEYYIDFLADLDYIRNSIPTLSRKTHEKDMRGP